MDLHQIRADQQRSVRVLIVEDEPIIALGIEDVLIDAGFQIAGVTGKIEGALEVIGRGGCDAAIVDANLAGVNTIPLAEALTQRGLPFIVMSGYSQEQMPSELAKAPFLQKPCRPVLLIKTLNALIENC